VICVSAYFMDLYVLRENKMHLLARYCLCGVHFFKLKLAVQ